MPRGCDLTNTMMSAERRTAIGVYICLCICTHFTDTRCLVPHCVDLGGRSLSMHIADKCVYNSKYTSLQCNLFRCCCVNIMTAEESRNFYKYWTEFKLCCNVSCKPHKRKHLQKCKLEKKNVHTFIHGCNRIKTV